MYLLHGYLHFFWQFIDYRMAGDYLAGFHIQCHQIHGILIVSKHDKISGQRRRIGKTLEQNLLSIVFDYEGNLWFATGGFRIYPDRGQQGALGYIARSSRNFGSHICHCHDPQGKSSPESGSFRH